MGELQDFSKRLLEVDLPIRALSNIKSRRPLDGDVDVRAGGLWWSRKPQNQCRALLLAACLPDPSSRLPEDRAVLRRILELCERERLVTRAECEGSDERKRAALQRVCLLAAEPGVARQAMQTLLPKLASELGLSNRIVLDPFSGGGSIPLEARRLGFEAIAGEYNPLAADQLRALLSWSRKERLGHDWQNVRRRILDAIEAAKRASEVAYPGADTLGFISFRALTCEGPGCGRTGPATSKFILDAQTRRHIAIAREGEPGGRVVLELSTSGKAPPGTMKQGGYQCPVCGFAMKRGAVVKQMESVRRQDFVVAAVEVDARGSRQLRPLTEVERVVLGSPVPAGHMDRLAAFVPNETWPTTEPRRFSPPLYGFRRFADCHTERQRLWLAGLCREFLEHQPSDHAERELYMGVARLCLYRFVEWNTSFCRWRADRGGSYEWTFSGKSIGMIWDYFEANPLHRAHDASQLVDAVGEHLFRCAELSGGGSVLEGPAQSLPLPDESVDYVYTDPPYFDAIPYSHLSDWMLVWARPLRGGLDGDGLAPKVREIVVDRPHSKSPSTHDAKYFEVELAAALRQVRRVMKPTGLGIVVFAHTSTAAWESLIASLLDSGFVVTASWPIETERGGRLQAQGTASLESSIHIVCRPRRTVSGGDVGDWREVLTELPRRIHEWLPRLAAEGISGADAIFACLGPALEVFSRYGRVEKISGERVELREYLEQVWAAVSHEALTMIFHAADTSGLEADARVTAMWLWTVASLLPDTPTDDGAEAEVDRADDEAETVSSSSKQRGFALEYDAARKIAQGLGARLEEMSHVVELDGDKARLLAPVERTKHLFGKAEGAPTTAKKAVERKQMTLFGEIDQAAEAQGWGEVGAPKAGTTTLDRVHQGMLLFGSGRGEALKRFIVEQGVGKQPQFWALAQSLSALYPAGTDEKRWVDGVLARKKGLGF